MATTNIGFDRGHPFVEAGANEGSLRFIEGRLEVVASSARSVGFSIDRSVDGGVTWEPVLDGGVSTSGANLVDYESLSYGDTLYRAVASTMEGATAETTIVVTATSKALWLSGGPAFGVTGRLPFNPKADVTAGRERALKKYAGRKDPVAISGEALARTIAVSGLTADEAIAEQQTADVELLTAIAQLEDALFLFRDPDGRRVYGAIDAVDLTRTGAVGANGLWGYSFTLTEADRSSR